MSARRGRMRWAAAALGLLLPGGALAAQETEPPPPLPRAPVAFPPFQEATFADGARLLVVSRHEVPFVTVTAAFRGGAAVDPPGMAGLSGALADLLTQGTATRSPDDVARVVDSLGATLEASSSEDWVAATLSVLTPGLDRGLGLLADALMNPVFSEDRLALERTRALSSLKASLGEPRTVAERAFTRAVYGDHPYGRLETPASVTAWSRDALVAYHEAWIQPSNALFVVAGDVDVEGARAALERAFGGWTGHPAPSVTYEPVPRRAQPELVLVDVPGSVQAVVRAGHVLMRGDDPDWTALSVADQVLGGGSSGRLFRVLREEKGWTYGAYASLERRRDLGTFEVSLETRSEVAPDAIAAVLEQVRRMREEMVPPGSSRTPRSSWWAPSPWASRPPSRSRPSWPPTASWASPTAPSARTRTASTPWGRPTYRRWPGST